MKEKKLGSQSDRAQMERRALGRDKWMVKHNGEASHFRLRRRQNDQGNPIPRSDHDTRMSAEGSKLMTATGRRQAMTVMDPVPTKPEAALARHKKMRAIRGSR